ncbi:MAG: hypothetical protein N2Z65_05450 [Clostridiales bacterium]|nr:hypothetical protein [Clostridiales bacterium]
MAKHQNEPIKTEAYLKNGESVCNLDHMKPEQKNVIGAALKKKYLNAVFADTAVFTSDIPLQSEIIFKDKTGWY